jgi:hypothetical protein
MTAGSAFDEPRCWSCTPFGVDVVPRRVESGTLAFERAGAWRATYHARLRANLRPHTIDLEETL